MCSPRSCASVAALESASILTCSGKYAPYGTSHAICAIHFLSEERLIDRNRSGVALARATNPGLAAVVTDGC